MPKRNNSDSPESIIDDFFFDLNPKIDIEFNTEYVKKLTSDFLDSVHENKTYEIKPGETIVAAIPERDQLVSNIAILDTIVSLEMMASILSPGCHQSQEITTFRSIMRDMLWSEIRKKFGLRDKTSLGIRFDHNTTLMVIVELSSSADFTGFQLGAKTNICGSC